MDPCFLCFVFVTSDHHNHPSGTSIKLYGRRGSQASGRIFFYFDNNKTIMDINGTATGDEVSLVYHADSVEDGDHEFSGALFISSAHMEINYFMCVAPLLHFVPRNVFQRSLHSQD